MAASDRTPATSGVPAGQTDNYFYGPFEHPAPLGYGVPCTSGSVYRLALVTGDACGIASLDLDVQAPPGTSGLVSAGSIWFLQLWYRDPGGGGAGFTLSNTLGVSFCLRQGERFQASQMVRSEQGLAWGHPI